VTIREVRNGRSPAVDPGFEALAELAPDDPRRAALRAELVTRHLGLAEHIARRFRGRGEAHDDLVQVARMGLVNAVDRYRPDRGTSFLSFAVPTIMGEVRRYFRDATWAVHVPRGLKEMHLRISDAVATLSQREGKAPTPSEIAEHLSLTVEQVCEGLIAGNGYRAISSDKPVAEEDESVSLGDTFGQYDADLEAVDDHESVKPLLRRLPERERRILMLRFFGNLTQTQIAERMGISQMHVSRLLSQTLETLRGKLIEDQ
jgi:RNA polymerase sigma-B factor